MALRAGPKQTFTGITASLASPDDVALIRNTFGAKALLLRLSNGNNANSVTITAAANFTGAGTPPNINGCSGYALLVSGSGSTHSSAPEGLLATIVANMGNATAPMTDILTPHVRIVLTAATGDVTGIILEAWPIFEENHPNLTGQVLPV